MSNILTANLTSDLLLDSWIHTCPLKSSELVIPDGCQDVIIETHEDRAERVFVSPLSSTAYSVEVSVNAKMMGFRLKPGTRINERGLFAYVAHNDLPSLLKGNQIDEFCGRSATVAEALECIGAGGQTVRDAAGDLGVSVRTLQRAVMNGTGMTPQFWLSLSRVRRTCRSLYQFEKLADAADAFGYSDQSHMTREVRRWLGVTPSTIYPDTDVYSRLCDSGYY